MAATIEFDTRSEFRDVPRHLQRCPERSRPSPSMGLSAGLVSTGPVSTDPVSKGPVSTGTLSSNSVLSKCVLVVASLLLLAVALTLRAPDAGSEVVDGARGGAVPTLSRASDGSPVRSGDYVVVGPGDTIRSVALKWAPEADPREMSEAIRFLNGGDTALEIGQVLALPGLDG